MCHTHLEKNTSADTGGSITQAAVYGKEENLCKFLR